MVAEDRDHATRFGRLMQSDTYEAGEYARVAAQEILDYCRGMTTEMAQRLAYSASLDNIQKVRKKALRRRDALQVNWCYNLHKTLSGG
jgi:hypothetical protein